ncbi:branched-chain amino acid transport system II carrier protein [Neorickettsia findlayensis]|uniref:Branched-chain amino acid transport system carrier protein n=1 Tax=Neorickettsia findlayensis TaxID=2686014 RepID=A0A6P1GAZ9_9RICK|nr:branched-chain amino acid transport system II carrier protein [Neorickettsia findlayensis]QHD65452.1 branched-chain amino acid ABC transporter [Neorickettsia findlayensis]
MPISKPIQVAIASLTIFAIFFGAGNLIYPTFVGLETRSNFMYGFLGFASTGIFLPLLGLISMIKIGCKTDEFFALAGKKVSTILVVLILLLLGPLGGIPRCIIVSFEALKIMSSSIRLIHFNFLFGTLTFLLVLRESEVVRIVGKWLTPALILGILVIVIAGISSNQVMSDATLTGFSSFTFAALEGYQTMDACAAIFFAKIILDYFKKEVPESDILNYSLLSSIFGFFLLGIVYAALLFLGAKYAINLNEIPKANLFNSLTCLVVGKASSVVVSFTVFFACLTTVIALVQLVSKWLTEHAGIDFKLSVCGTVVCSMISASFGFQTLTTLLISILSLLYPALIVLILCNLASGYCQHMRKYSPVIFWLAAAISTYMAAGL